MTVEQVTADLIESRFAHINVACQCKKCDGIAWIKLTAAEYAVHVVATGTDLADWKQMQKLNHSLLQASKVAA